MVNTLDYLRTKVKENLRVILLTLLVVEYYGWRSPEQLAFP